MEEKIDKIFKDVIGAGPEVDRAILVYGEIPGWDSVAHMALVAALEQEFDCMLDMDDILDMSSYAKSIEIMKKYV
ncbi:MAG: acyl carrier protein [Sphingomonas sp.]|nr:acyl carrier protein [Sphingomonas sp.]